MRMFPILLSYTERGEGCPTSIPWRLLESDACEAQAQDNHSQTLERLAERGGLGPCELLAVLLCVRYRDSPAYNRPFEERVKLLKARIADLKALEAKEAPQCE